MSDVPDQHRRRIARADATMPAALRAVLSPDSQAICPRCGVWHKRRYAGHDEDEVCAPCARDAAQYDSVD